jgi:hypothetical protein
MKVLIMTPTNHPVGWWTTLKFIPRIGEQMHFKGKGYTVSMVRHFLDADEIKEYKNNTPFIRVMLMNL